MIYQKLETIFGFGLLFFGALKNTTSKKNKKTKKQTERNETEKKKPRFDSYTQPNLQEINCH